MHQLEWVVYMCVRRPPVSIKVVTCGKWSESLHIEQPGMLEPQNGSFSATCSLCVDLLPVPQ